MIGFFRYFVYTSWWVALCAASMGLLAWFELTGSWWNAPLFVFILGSTLVIYNMNMLSGFKELRQMGTESERHHWCLENERAMKFTLVAGFLLTGGSVWFLNRAIWLLMLPLALVAGAYVMPMVRKNAAKIRIREIGLWKIFIIAAVWAGITVILPAVHLYGFDQFFELLSWKLALERAIFILAITIPFDIRDLVNDAKKNVRTLPSVLGWKKAVWLSQILIFVFLLMIFGRVGVGHPLFIGYLVSASITILALAMATPKRSDMYCSFWVEGTMLLQFLAVLFFSVLLK